MKYYSAFEKRNSVIQKTETNLEDIMLITDRPILYYSTVNEMSKIAKFIETESRMIVTSG